MKFLLLNNSFHYKNYNAITSYRCYELTEIDVDNEIETLEEVENNYSISLQDYDIIYSPTISYDVKNYQNNKFLFGPHFSVFPEEKDMKKISYPNAVYLQPSLWAVEYWNRCDTSKRHRIQVPFPKPSVGV